MKIAWYTPFSAMSAIGRFSSLVVAALRRSGVEIQVVRSETKTASLRGAAPADPDEKWIWATDIHRNPAKRLQEFDLVIYNLGDHYDFHTYCFQHQPVAPGLTILHDYSLHHALHHYCLRDVSSTGNYRDHLATECGEEATAIYDRLMQTGSQQLWWHYEISRFPLYRWAIRESLGVVTHADFYRQVVANRIGCPTTSIPLAYDAPSLPVLARSRRPTEPLTILTVGSVNPNKRYEAVIRAIAESPTLANGYRYRIVGPADTVQREMIEMALGGQAQRPDVTITGHVSRDELAQELASADVISCLRYPALEGASASVVEGILSGKPVIVCETGCYREIPDELVIKVNPNHEHTQLSEALAEILADYSTATQRAQAAAAWAQARHSPTAYAEQLLEFAHSVLYNEPIVQLTDRLAGHLSRWHVQQDDQLLSRLNVTMHDLFGSPTDRSRAA